MIYVIKHGYFFEITIKNFQIAKEEHTAVKEPQPSTSIEFEETGVVMNETTATKTIVSVI